MKAVKNDTSMQQRVEKIMIDFEDGVYEYVLVRVIFRLNLLYNLANISFEYFHMWRMLPAEPVEGSLTRIYDRSWVFHFI